MTDYAADMRHVALALASSELDDDATEQNVSEAMWLIKNDVAREELSDGLGVDAVDACSSDDGYERTLNLLLNALVLEVESIADSPGATEGEPTGVSTGISRAVCRLVVRSSLGADHPPTEMDMQQEAMDILTETLSGEHELGVIALESFLSAARLPLGDDNRGEYGPALILARHMNEIAPPPEDDDARKWNSSAEDRASAFRRDLMDLLGRRVFVLGGKALPASPEEVRLCAPLIRVITKDEFDGSILRPLKFKLTSAPGLTMDTLAAFVDVLAEAGNGNYVESHLGGGTNMVGVALKQLKSGQGMVAAAKAMAALAGASPHKGAVAVTEAMAKALKEESADESARIGLCLGLEAAARSLLARREEGIEEEVWVRLAEEVALPALEGSGGYDGQNSAEPWYELAGRDPSPAAAKPAAKPAAAAAAAGVAAAFGAGAAAAAAKPAPSSRDAADAAAKERVRAGRSRAPAASRPGAQNVDDLDDRIAAKQRGASRERTSAVAAAAAARGGGDARDGDAAIKARARSGMAASRPGAQSAHDLDQRIQEKAGQRGGSRAPSGRGGQTKQELDRLDQRIRQKSRQSGGAVVPLGPEDDDWERIQGKKSRGAYDEGEEDHRGSVGQKILVSSGAGTSHGVGVTPGGGIRVKHNDAEVPHDELPIKDDHYPGQDDTRDARPVGGYGEEVEYPDDEPEYEVNHGVIQEPDMTYGMEVGEDGLGPDGLAVAVAVSPDEEEAFIPAAIEYDPDSKPPLYKNRRFRIYSIAALCLLVLVVVALVVSVVKKTTSTSQITNIKVTQGTPSPTPPPTPAPTPTSWTRGVKEQIVELVGQKAYEPESAYQKAMNWILDEDPRQLEKDSPFITQRYLLALLYYSADVKGEWRNCAPSDDPDDVLCNATVFDQEGDPMNGTFSRVLSKEHECTWYGVRCPGGDEFVREIEMIENNMTGTLPTELAMMPVLQRLSFIMNELTGTIPSEYGSMKHLIDIEFHYNLFTGTIPDEIYNADNLIRFNIGGNLLSGTISPNIRNLRSLVGLFTFDNKFEGEIPKEVGELSYLSYTRWSYNFHSGKMPTAFGKLTNLLELYLQWNEFTGHLPTIIGNLRYLEDFFINNNQLTGTLPITFYSMENLLYFYCFDNALSGTISPMIRRLASLERFIIRRNYFTGQIPSELANLQNISMLWMHYNDFTGTVSDKFCDMYDEPYQLTSFYTDCGPSAGTGPPAVTCDCCTDCCDSIEETCLSMDS